MTLMSVYSRNAGAVAIEATSRITNEAQLRAQQELEWGIDLAQKGELAPAASRFERAVAFDPENRQAAQALAEARLRRSSSSVEARP